MAEKPNEEANFQSSQLTREEDSQKLVGDGGNNTVIAPWPEARLR